MRRLLSPGSRPRPATTCATAETWIVTCDCGTTVSLWAPDRVRAAIRRMRRAVVCPTCDRRFVGKVRRTTD